MFNYIEVLPSNKFIEYITFLKGRFLENVVYTNIKLAYDFKLPFMKQMEGLSEKRIFEIFEMGLIQFFNDVLIKTPIKGVVDILED